MTYLLAFMPRGSMSRRTDTSLWIARAVLAIAGVGGWVWAMAYVVRRYG